MRAGGAAAATCFPARAERVATTGAAFVATLRAGAATAARAPEGRALVGRLGAGVEFFTAFLATEAVAPFAPNALVGLGLPLIASAEVKSMARISGTPCLVNKTTPDSGQRLPLLTPPRRKSSCIRDNRYGRALWCLRDL